MKNSISLSAITISPEFGLSMVCICSIYQQCGKVVKSVMIDGERERHGTDLKPSCTILLCPWRKTLYGTFFCLVVLASSFKFQSHLK